MTLVPFQNWYDGVDNAQKNALEYVLCYFSGIFLFSTLTMMIYILFKRNRPQIFPQSIVPSMICGVLWAIATVLFMITDAVLGMLVGQTVLVIGPIMVSSLWSVFVFREVQGTKNLSLLSIALSLNIISVVFIVLSQILNSP